MLTGIHAFLRNTSGWPQTIQLTFDEEPAPPTFAVVAWREIHKNTPMSMLPITADPQHNPSMYSLLTKYLIDHKRVILLSRILHFDHFSMDFVIFSLQGRVGQTPMAKHSLSSSSSPLERDNPSSRLSTSLREQTSFLRVW